MLVSVRRRGKSIARQPEDVMLEQYHASKEVFLSQRRGDGAARALKLRGKCPLLPPWRPFAWKNELFSRG
jgi:hypothetical protein